MDTKAWTIVFGRTGATYDHGGEKAGEEGEVEASRQASSLTIRREAESDFFLWLFK